MLITPVKLLVLNFDESAKYFVGVDEKRVPIRRAQKLPLDVPLKVHLVAHATTWSVGGVLRVSDEGETSLWFTPAISPDLARLLSRMAEAASAVER